MIWMMGHSVASAILLMLQNLERMADMQKGHAAVQRGLNSLEKKSDEEPHEVQQAEVQSYTCTRALHGA